MWVGVVEVMESVCVCVCVRQVGRFGKVQKGETPGRVWVRVVCVCVRMCVCECMCV